MPGRRATRASQRQPGPAAPRQMRPRDADQRQRQREDEVVVADLQVEARVDQHVPERDQCRTADDDAPRAGPRWAQRQPQCHRQHEQARFGEAQHGAAPHQRRSPREPGATGIDRPAGDGAGMAERDLEDEAVQQHHGQRDTAAEEPTPATEMLLPVPAVIVPA